ncbi:MAG: 30S ribosomal protein S12 methylthiotransferase RimO [Treponema sp.]|jgi:ribosomal protein S12 methylthiotransferase|nr:30S ribosomal protein S12 methylthiotransferase RimO [Treponema sp.]
MRYFLDPFGCAKNQVDAENMMASLNRAGWAASGPEEADLIIINSCGFIESAKQESINAVLAWRKLYPKKKILLAGCLAQRYEKELKEALPEADSFFGVDDLSGIVKAAQETVAGGMVYSTEPHSGVVSTIRGSPLDAAVSPAYDERTAFVQAENPQGRGFSAKVTVTNSRPILSLPGSAYVKISEGCDNRCSFCAIPLIRGNLKSRGLLEIKDECKQLLDRGIKELCIIAQDIASYGKDFGLVSDKKISLQNSALANSALPELLGEISRLKGEFWVRLLYIHPDHFPLPILDLMKKDSRFLHYFDLPFQHGSERILRLMNRKGNAEEYLALIGKIRSTFPDAVLRSTFMTGFPGETDEDFDALLDFQKQASLDWAGFFVYSREEDTPAFSMKPRVSKKLALQRKQLLEEAQVLITEKQMDRFVGRDFTVLVEEKVEGEEGLWLGRLPCQAPDIDGSAVISCDGELKLGSLVKGRVFNRAGFDLEVKV